MAGEGFLDDLGVQPGDRLAHDVPAVGGEGPDRLDGNPGLEGGGLEVGAPVRASSKALALLVRLVARRFLAKVVGDLGARGLQGHRLGGGDLHDLDDGEAQIALDRPLDRACRELEGRRGDLAVGDRGGRLVRIEDGLRSDGLGDGVRVLPGLELRGGCRGLARVAHRDLDHGPGLGIGERALLRIESLLHAGRIDGSGGRDGGGGEPHQRYRAHLRTHQLGGVRADEGGELGVGGRRGLGHARRIEHEPGEVAVLERGDGGDSSEDTGCVEAARHRRHEMAFGQFVGDLGLSLGGGDPLARQRLGEARPAELSGHRVEGDGYLLDLLVDQLRTRRDADPAEEFGERLVLGDGLEQLLVKPILGQEQVR